MAFIVDHRCINCLHKTCVEVCPVDCFHLGVNMTVIDPLECIDCKVCEPVCPEKAISLFKEPEDKQRQYWADFNAHYCKVWPRTANRDDVTEGFPPIDKEDYLRHETFVAPVG